MSDKNVKININYHEVHKSERCIKLEHKFSEAYNEYRRQWEENPQTATVAPFPLHLNLETTNLCNLKCPMCSRTLKAQKGYLKSGQFMDFHLFKQIIDEGAKKGLKAVKLNGNDTEPLMSKDLADRIRYAKQKGILDVIINTNATLLTKENSKKLVDSGLDRLAISFDSPYKEKYEKIRIGADFEQVMSNIINFLEIRGDNDYPIVRIAMVKMKDTVQDINDFIQMWKDKVDILSVLEYQNPHSMDEEQKSTYEPKINHNFVCSQLWQRLQIKVDGNVSACCCDYMNELNLGNAYDKSISEIWHSSLLNKYRKLHREGNATKLKACRMCGLIRLPNS